MSADNMVHGLLADPAEIVGVLRRETALAPYDLHGTDIDAIVNGAKVATSGLEDNVSLRLVDAALAEVIHKAVAPVRDAAPWVLNDPLFWQALAFGPMRDYTLIRWCEGGDWLSQVDAKPHSGVKRFVLTAGSVKTHARHSVRRLYIYADCSYSVRGDYGDLDKVVVDDQDILTAVFERRLGLSPKLALALINAAGQLVATKKSATAAPVSARDKRREFFRQVNLLVSTVALEYLDEPDVMGYLNAIVKEVS